MKLGLFASRRLGFFAAMLALIAAGLAVRLLSLGLPPFAVKYLGSSVWGAMVFAAVGVLLPERTREWRVAAALGIAVLTELFRLYHEPALDAFRLTLAGRLLIGQIFSPWNLVAYAIGIAAAALATVRLRRPTAPAAGPEPSAMPSARIAQRRALTRNAG